MFKKLTSIILVLCILMLSCPYVFAADNDSGENEEAETRTMEEILNEYHAKSLAAQISSETDTPSTYSRQSGDTSKTLEEETVDVLIAAGYEAYNVTASNYESLENKLRTDFASLGLNSQGSYIIVISTEENINDINDTGIKTASIDPITPEPDDGTFTYAYNGTTYTMRYLTVTSDTNANLKSNGSVFLLKKETITSAVLSKLENVLNTGIYLLIDGVSHYPVSTVGGALGLNIVDFTEVYDAIFYVDVAANWTRTYTQIQNTSTNTWASFSSVDYVLAHIQYRGSYYDTNINDYASCYQQYNVYEYSAHYTNYTWRKQQAAIGYERATANHEYVGDVQVYKDPKDESSKLALTLYQLKLG